MQLDMTNLSVDYKAVGFEGTIVLAELPEATIKAALVYGVRRLIQDSCNSEAFKLRKEQGLDKDAELPESDRKTIHDARIGAMKAGTIGVRTAKAVTGLSPELARFMQEHRANIKAKVDAKAYKDADAAGRDAMLAEWIMAQSESVQARMFKTGHDLITDDANRARKAKELSDLF